MDANEIKVTRVMNAVAAGTSDQNSSSVDMSGFENVTFIAAFGTIDSTAVTSIKVQQSSDDSSFADLAGTSISVADDDDNQVAVVSVVKPRERYVRCVVDRGTANAVIDGVVALQTGALTLPVTQPTSSVVSSEVHVSPAEGTA